jgi:hypothetical protein
MMTATRQLGELEHTLLNAPDTGALTGARQGHLGLRNTVVGQFDIQAGEIAKNLTNDRQRFAYQRAREQRRGSLIDRLDAHIVTEMAAYEKGETEASLASAVNFAVANADNPRRVAEEPDRVDLIVESSKRALGLRGDQFAGRYYLADGHHRAVAALGSGRDDVGGLRRRHRRGAAAIWLLMDGTRRQH